MARSIIIVLGVSLFAGCGAMKNMLRPMVCDCEKKEVACTEPKSIAESPMVDVPRQTDSNSKPVIEQQVSASEAAKLEPIDPSSAGAKLIVADHQKALRNRFGKPPLFAFKGNFSSKKGTDWVGADDDFVRIANGKWKAAFPVDTLMRADEIKGQTFAPFAGELVKDGELELVLFTIDSSNQTQRVYSVQVYKAIGERIGIVFDQPFAVKTATGLTTLAKVDFVDGAHHRRIRVTPVSSDGLLDLSKIKVYSWNKWEGMFRVPRKPPTAP